MLFWWISPILPAIALGKNFKGPGVTLTCGKSKG